MQIKGLKGGFSLQKLKMRDRDCQYKKGGYKRWREIFISVSSGRAKGNGFKLTEGRFSLDIKKNLFCDQGREVL